MRLLLLLAPLTALHAADSPKQKPNIVFILVDDMLEFVDLSVGRVLDALDDLKLADNTMVILASDNGGVRVPLFIRWPGQIQPGSHSNAPMHFVDLFPTLCDAAGVKPDPAHKLDGTNLRPLFTGGTLPERTLFATYPHYIAEFGTTPVRAAIQGRYKLVWNPYDHIEIAGDRVTTSTIRYVPKPRVELFAMASDPGEHENIADKYPEKVSEMKSLMETWMKQTGAKDPTPNPAYDPSRPLFNTREEAIKKAREEKAKKWNPERPL